MKKGNKYEKYFNSNGGIKFCAKWNIQVLHNIVDDAGLCDDYKIEFFEYLEKYNGSDIREYFCNGFFFKYQLKGKNVSNFKYNNEVGRVMPENAFIQRLYRLMPPSTHRSPPSSRRDFNTYIKSFISYKNKSTVDFEQFVKDNGMGDFKIANFLMWTFERLEGSSKVYDDTKYDMSDLPCLLGLPNVNGTEENYKDVPRITFLLKVPTSIAVYKPTAFDADLNPCWRPGGKTKKHKDAPAKYNRIDGFEEYVHEAVYFKDIISNIYKI
ncbi:MAG: hypothetical protein LBE13_19685 [Bacteroidales bacterium]|jgi:hypothetical protein|nr:hypothetical protein [Bacteroidales bacterium]